jgi:uncharacterized protein
MKPFTSPPYRVPAHGVLQVARAGRADGLTAWGASLYFDGMVSRRDATVNLAALLRHSPGADDDVSAEGALEPDDDALRAIGLRLDGPIEWSLQVINAGGDDDFVVTGDVHGTTVLECRRCLTDVATHVQTSLVYPMRYRPGDATEVHLTEDDAGEDVLEFEQPLVDFAPLIVQVFAIEQPLTVLCREDCKGLSIDGVNLNDHPDHVADERVPEKASPFAKLKDFDL